MQIIVDEIEERLSRLDFNDLWPGFKKYEYALYDEKNVYLNEQILDVDLRFIGNTRICFEGRYIVIWKVSESEKRNIDLLTSYIVHEMFHIHQYMLKDKRTIDEFEGLKYSHSIENFQLRYKEQHLLVNAQLEKDISKKRNLFNQFIINRKNRINMTNNDISYEKSVETFEGTAEFIMLKVLKVLNRNAYDSRIDKTCEVLSELSENLFLIRKSSYFTGALICNIANDLKLDVYKEIGLVEKYLFDYFESDVSCDEHDNEEYIIASIVIEEMYNFYIEGIETEIENIISDNNSISKEGNFSTITFDPRNMVRFNNMTLHRNFLNVYDGVKVEYLEGPIITVSSKDDYPEFNKYITISSVG